LHVGLTVHLKKQLNFNHTYSCDDRLMEKKTNYIWINDKKFNVVVRLFRSNLKATAAQRGICV